MNRFVLRFDKFNKGAGLQGILDHCARRKVPPNADPSKAHLNRFSGNSDPQCYVIAGRKRVAAVETVVSASREWFQGVGHGVWQDYVHAAALHLERHFGGSAMFTAQHYDERAPHVHFLHCPHAIGTSAKSMIGGPKSRLTMIQTLFEKEVAQRYGLCRIKGSLGSHTKLREFYTGLDEQFQDVKWRVQPKRVIDEMQLEVQLARAQVSEIIRRYEGGDETLLRMIAAELDQEMMGCESEHSSLK